MSENLNNNLNENNENQNENNNSNNTNQIINNDNADAGDRFLFDSQNQNTQTQNTNANNVNTEINQSQSQTQQNQSETPMVMYKKENPDYNPYNIQNTQNSQNPSGFYRTDYSSNSPEDSYNKLTVKEDNAQNQAYRWNIGDEEAKAKNKNKKAKKQHLGLKIFAVVISAMFLISAVTSGVLLAGKLSQPNDNASSPVISNQNAVDNSNSGSSSDSMQNTVITVPQSTGNEQTLTTPEAIEKVKPSVVCIQTEVPVAPDPYSGFFGGGSGSSDGSNVQQGTGTGFILTADGYIATNYHVVDGATKITVTLNSGDNYNATLIGGDEVADLAVVKIDAKNLPISPLGDSDALVQGETVVAIGSPAGIEFAGTCTQGIVSAINRDVDVTDTRKMTVIQTDASINPGNSGGPLVNMKGQVIGINTMKLSSSLYEGMGFSIPINTAIPTFNDIIANPGKINRAAGSSGNTVIDTSNVSFGISGQTITADISAQKNIPQGFQIATIDPSGPCANSGLQTSDIITALDGQTVTSFDDLANLKQNYKPGDQVTITIYRNGDSLDFTITLASK
ncbi:MAG: trypsin-like peptidase domain-containing protein [Oscillospiraceae bacterium]|nr:trypsin-like peptidase domain-containing protein [Oscillospiraceae bacterium]